MIVLVLLLNFKLVSFGFNQGIAGCECLGLFHLIIAIGVVVVMSLDSLNPLVIMIMTEITENYLKIHFTSQEEFLYPFLEHFLELLPFW